MLQQTRVDTVVPYFERFIKRFPTVRKLAEAPEEEVLRYWSGLGYYRRARNLHRSARDLFRDYGGRFPRSKKALLSLPGVGRYTAGAVLSIAFGQREPVVDGNVERVLSRLFTLREDLAATTGKKRVWELAEVLVPENSPGDFNQALMELGALVCLPTAPLCSHCPLHRLCRTRKEGSVERYPVKTRNTKREKVEEVVLLIRRGDRRLLTRTNREGLYEGLWQFPWAWRKKGEGSLDKTVANLLRRMGADAARFQERKRLTHTVTHRSILTAFYQVELKSPKAHEFGPDFKWVSAKDLVQEALPAYQKRVIRFLPE